MVKLGLTFSAPWAVYLYYLASLIQASRILGKLQVELVDMSPGEIPLAHRLFPASCLPQAFRIISPEAFGPDAVTGQKLSRSLGQATQDEILSVNHLA